MGEFSTSVFAVKQEDGDSSGDARGEGAPSQAASSTHHESSFSPALPPLSTSHPAEQAPASFSQDMSPATTEHDDHADAMASKPKKKGIAATVKKGPRKVKNTGASKAAGGSKTSKKTSKKDKTDAGSDGEDGEGGEDESDNGPYCICRGPDDHRWMIACDQCEDWFHGQCVRLDKETGENLVEKFVCPNCTDLRRGLVTRYKKTCSLAGCKRPARIYGDGKKRGGNDSVFCSPEHSQQWWEQMVGRLPKKQASAAGAGLGQLARDQLTQQDFMALLDSDLVEVDEVNGTWKLSIRPFKNATGKRKSAHDAPQEPSVDWVRILTNEETSILRKSEADRAELLEEKKLCEAMIQLLDWAGRRKQEAVDAKKMEKDICGYDSCLDTVSVKAQFAAWMRSTAAQAIFAAQKLDGGSAADGMCDKKRCKTHIGWHPTLKKAVLFQIKEIETAYRQKASHEEVVKSAAEERFMRKQKEKNWVEDIQDETEDEEGDQVMGGVEPSGELGKMQKRRLGSESTASDDQEMS